MAMPKRISASRRVVAICDPALSYNFPQLKTKVLDNGQEVPDIGLVPYGATLNIEFLGDLDKLPVKPTVFEIMPLQSRFMNWDRGEDTDWRSVFQFHVIGIKDSGFDAELTYETVNGMDYKTLDDDSMDMIPDSFVKDIANMVIQLAKYDGATIPFSMLGTSTATLKRCRDARSLRIFPVPTVDVKTSD
jgi:hypothetical protein